jgi:hypothetical protein
VQAGNQIEQGGLATPVGADQTDEVALFDLERDVINRSQASEGLHNVSSFQENGAGVFVPGY